jgi:hypothetical protein
VQGTDAIVPNTHGRVDVVHTLRGVVRAGWTALVIKLGCDGGVAGDFPPRAVHVQVGEALHFDDLLAAYRAEGDVESARAHRLYADITARVREAVLALQTQSNLPLPPPA